MKFHDAPKVILVGQPSIYWPGVTSLLEEYGLDFEGWRRDLDDVDGDGLPELMGRLCYGSFGAAQGRIGARAYIANILDGGHGSVLEHANWSFVICRASRGFTHQMVRHRAGSAMSQESQHFIRYAADEGDPKAPEAAACLTGIPESERTGAEGAIRAAVLAYVGLWKGIRAKFAPDAKVKKIVSGAARGLLPGALESRLGFTANARALRHICELRGTEDNTLEIRLVAVQLAEIMMREAPAIFQDFAVVEGSDGHPVVKSGHKKV